MLSLFGKYLRKRERARERLNWQHSKMDRASIADISLPVHAVQATSSYAESRSTSAEWIARAAIILIASGMAWYTWGHWGDFQIDNGRELYVPVSILHGKLLYRDVWYMYGPWRRTNPPYTVMIYERKVVGQASSQTGGLQPN